MGRKGPRRRLDRGIYADKYGVEVMARVGRRGGRRYKRYPLGTSLHTMQAWRDGTAAQLREEQPAKIDPVSLSASIDRYLEKTKNKSGPERAALEAWRREYGDRDRRRLTSVLCQQAFDCWKTAGYSPQSLYYRRLSLLKLYRALDGPTTKTPVDHIVVRRPKSRRPIWVPDEIIHAVALELLKHEQLKWLRTPKTRARFLVLASTGQRPAQLKRAKPSDVDLARGIWWVQAAKGGEPIPVFLNADMRAAWKLFFHAQAWGPFDKRNFVRTLRRAGWPKGVRPYTVRHAVALSLRERGADLADIQDHLGHTSMSTTRIYASAIESRMRKVSASLEGRFGWGKR